MPAGWSTAAPDHRVTGSLNDWYFAEAHLRHLRHLLLLATPGTPAPRCASVPAGGTPRVSRDYFVAAHSRFTLPVDEVPAFRGLLSMSVHSSAPSCRGAPCTSFTTTASRTARDHGGHAPSGDWYFAGGCCPATSTATPALQPRRRRRNRPLTSSWGGRRCARNIPSPPGPLSPCRSTASRHGGGGLPPTSTLGPSWPSGPCTSARAWSREGTCQGPPSPRPGVLRRGCTASSSRAISSSATGGAGRHVDVDFFLGDGKSAIPSRGRALARHRPIQELPFLDFRTRPSPSPPIAGGGPSGPSTTAWTAGAADRPP